MVPGFTDAHVHFLEWSLALGRLDLSGARALDAEVLARPAASAPPAGYWLIGAGWRPERWPAGDPAPQRQALDAACGGRPALLWAHDHHTAWLSSAALARLPVGSAPVVERDDAGEPTGILRETAAWNAAAAIPPPPEREPEEAVMHGPRQAHARGVTGIHDFQREHGLAVWQRLNAERRLDAAGLGLAAGRAAFGPSSRSVAQRPGDEWLRIGPVKAFADGTLGSRTASMLEPFVDAGRASRCSAATSCASSRGAAPTRGSISPSTRSGTPPTGPSSTHSRRRASAGRRAGCALASSTRSCCTPQTSRASPSSA